mmetsp:Transcript_22406/g.53028  ORF Transcript_22406/g.53028 Transcript_22406/m.53028 type:complete len:235 (+) Transcript_22406:134-838(+)
MPSSRPQYCATRQILFTQHASDNARSVGVASVRAPNSTAVSSSARALLVSADIAPCRFDAIVALRASVNAAIREDKFKLEASCCGSVADGRGWSWGCWASSWCQRATCMTNDQNIDRRRGASTDTSRVFHTAVALANMGLSKNARASSLNVCSRCMLVDSIRGVWERAFCSVSVTATPHSSVSCSQLRSECSTSQSNSQPSLACVTAGPIDSPIQHSSSLDMASRTAVSLSCMV